MMDIETGFKASTACDATSADGLRKRGAAALADDVIERLVMECDSDEQYGELMDSLLAQAPSPEAVAALREKLQVLRQIASERDAREKQRKPGMIDDNFLSVVFAIALVVVLGAAIAAFQGLYSAIAKKVPVNVTRPMHGAP